MISESAQSKMHLHLGSATKSIPGSPWRLPRVPELRGAIGGQMIKKKNSMCDMRQKIQTQVDRHDDFWLQKCHLFGK